MDVIGYAGQIIEVIQALHGVYVRVKGLGKEINDAMDGCRRMEIDVLSLKKMFDKNMSSKYPEQIKIITGEFKSLHQSIKKLRKLFKEYDRISKKLFGKFVWAYDKPRESIMAILSSFDQYQAMFTKALHILNEGHNKDQERAIKNQERSNKDHERALTELRKVFEKERKKQSEELNKRLKTMAQQNMESEERLYQRIRDLIAKNEATPENTSKAYERWLVDEKGVEKEEAKSCASTAIREGRVPAARTEEVSKPKKGQKDPGTTRDSIDKKGPAIKTEMDYQIQSSKPKSKLKSKITSQPDALSASAVAILLPAETSSPYPHTLSAAELASLSSAPSLKARKPKKGYHVDDEKKVEKRNRRLSRTESPEFNKRIKETENDNSPTPSSKHIRSDKPKDEALKPKKNSDEPPSPDLKHVQAPAEKDKVYKPSSPVPKEETKEIKPPRRPKVPVILIQKPQTASKPETATHRHRSHSPSPSHTTPADPPIRANSTRAPSNKRSSSPSPSTSSHIATSGRMKRASSVSSTKSAHVAKHTPDSTSESASKAFIAKQQDTKPKPSSPKHISLSSPTSNGWINISTLTLSTNTPSSDNEAFIATMSTPRSKDSLTSPKSTSASASNLFREKIEKGMRHVKEGEKRGRLSDERARRRSGGQSLLEVGNEEGGTDESRPRARSEARLVEAPGGKLRFERSRRRSSGQLNVENDGGRKGGDGRT